MPQAATCGRCRTKARECTLSASNDSIAYFPPAFKMLIEGGFFMAKKQKSGLYRTKVKIGVDANGKDINKWISGSTKAELERARQDVIKYYILGIGVQEDQLFGEYAVRWYKIHKEPGLSPSSRELYRTALNKDILPEFAGRQLRAITATDIQIFINHYADCSASKITYIVATLRGIFKQAFAESIILKDPTLNIKKPAATSAKDKYVLTEKDRAAIVEVCATHEHGAYLACMYYLGLRPGEVRGLQWGDFDWENNLVHIQRDIDFKANGYAGALKTASSNRLVPVPTPLKNILVPRIGADAAFLFQGDVSGSAFSKTSAERIWVSLMVACGLASPIKIGTNKYRESDPRSRFKPLFTPHTMRHNYITMCWENGFDAYTTMRIVGHKSIKTTLDIYTHLSDKQMQKAVASVEDMFSPETVV